MAGLPIPASSTFHSFPKLRASDCTSTPVCAAYGPNTQGRRGGAGQRETQSKPHFQKKSEAAPCFTECCRMLPTSCTRKYLGYQQLVLLTGHPANADTCQFENQWKKFSVSQFWFFHRLIMYGVRQDSQYTRSPSQVEGENNSTLMSYYSVTMRDLKKMLQNIEVHCCFSVSRSMWPVIPYIQI